MAHAGPSSSPSSIPNEDKGNLFEDLSFYLSTSLRRDAADLIRRVLDKNGASMVSASHMNQADYIITESHTLERDELGSDALSGPPLIVTVSKLLSRSTRRRPTVVKAMRSYDSDVASVDMDCCMDYEIA